MSKSKKQAATPPKPLPTPKKKPSPSSSPRRRTLFFALLAMLGLLGGYYYFAQPGKKTSAGFSNELESEPTLKAAKPRLQLLSASETGVEFENQILETEQNNILTNINMYNGGGVSVADFNNDNLPDIYFICSNGKNRLYLNEGGLKFKDITDVAGVGSEEGFETAATAVDVNADGWLDIYVCRSGPEENEARRNRLFVNNATGQTPTFTERAREYGLDDKSASTGANFFDADGDGDLDLYLLNYPGDLKASNKIGAQSAVRGIPAVNLGPQQPYDSDRLYRNEGTAAGSAHFVDVSQKSGVWNFAYGLSVSVSDFNGDGSPDIYVGNDFIQPDILYINDRKGGFSDQFRQYFRHSSQHTMGSDLTDFDNDGAVDLFAVDMLPYANFRQKTLLSTNPQAKYTALKQSGYPEPVVRNVLQRNNGNGTFSDIACMADVFKTDWSWSGLVADLDNDGLKDLHITNGYRRDLTNKDFMDFRAQQQQSGSKQDQANSLLDQMPQFKTRNFVYQNQGDWRFEEKSGDWMTMPASWSCGSAWADFDADGDLDLVVNNLEQPAFIYKNLTREQQGGSFLQAKLKGSTQNPFAVGASILIEYQGLKQYQELSPTRGIFSGVEHLIHFGLGQAPQIDKLTVRWPDGKFQIIANVATNQRLDLKWADAAGYIASIQPAPLAETLFHEATAADFKHQENQYNDFEVWPLNPWSLTDLGPLTAQGDVNGDGLTDFFVGNGPSVAGAVFLQMANGAFRQTSAAAFEQDKDYEDHGGLFFDADGDADLDLFVLSGGAELGGTAPWQCRLYLNDGKGNFQKSPNKLPAFNNFGLRAAAYDYDLDGDQDLFIGGRLVPKNWPLVPKSTVLQNNNGNFTDVTAQVGGDFARCGMVTDLAWAELDGDQDPELIAVGEWMSISVFKLKNNHLENVTAQFGLANTNGLWNRLAIADLDKDGDMDLITGNLGLNTRFTAKPDAPLRCYARDFDNNGTLDPIIAFQEGKAIHPLVQKEVLVKQLPALKKKFLYSKNYAQATMADIYPQKDLDASLNLVCNELETCWWENQAGKFVRRTLPRQAQSAPVAGIGVADFNGDGHDDLLLAGNKYSFEVETNRCDAGNGVFLSGDGKGNFTWIDNRFSGFWAMREARDLAVLRGSNGQILVAVANNSSPLQIFKR
jgi:hypothetical protein